MSSAITINWDQFEMIQYIFKYDKKSARYNIIFEGNG